MTRAPLHDRPDAAVIAEDAARWHLRLIEEDGGQHGLRAPFEAWRAADPRHARAYDDVVSAWQLARTVSDTPDMLALRQQALARLVVARRPQPMARTALAAGLAFTLMVAGGAWLWTSPFGGTQDAQIAEAQGQLHRSRIGQRLSVALADGSTAMLNTDSQLRVQYDGGERRLILERGQAYFTVAHGDRRPFRVVALGNDIVARGTAFDVRLRRESVTVALLEGELNVRTIAAGPPLRLRPNQLLVATRSGRVVQAIGDTAPLIGWSEGLVVFQNQSVAEAAAEMNRYLTRPIVVEGEALSSARISGTFRTGESTAFLDALRHYFPIRVDESAGDRIRVAAQR